MFTFYVYFWLLLKEAAPPTITSLIPETPASGKPDMPARNLVPIVIEAGNIS